MTTEKTALMKQCEQLREEMDLGIFSSYCMSHTGFPDGITIVRTKEKVPRVFVFDYSGRIPLPLDALKLL
jgi:hypothetical protein